MKGYHGYAPKWQAKDDGSQITSPLPAFSFNAEEPKTPSNLTIHFFLNPSHILQAHRGLFFDIFYFL